MSTAPPAQGDGHAHGNGDLRGLAAPPEGPPLDLPPVEPPSAGFILQLFIIPAVIVAVLVVVVALFGKLAEGGRDAMAYVESIRSDNDNVRWRAAYELASLIHNEPKLASDPKLLARLADLLADELGREKADPATAQYLAAAIGSFQTLRADPPSSDPMGALIEALAPNRPIKVRVAAAEGLARHAARAEAEGAGDSSIASDWIGSRAVEALSAALADPSSDPELRQRVAFALGFCPGPPAVEALRRANADDPDRYTRFNAAVALARRGDPAPARTFREMLSTADLERVVEASNPAETQHRIEAIQLEALETLLNAARSGRGDLAASLRDDVAALAGHSPFAGVRAKASELLKVLQARP